MDKDVKPARCTVSEEKSEIQKGKLKRKVLSLAIKCLNWFVGQGSCALVLQV